MRLRSSGIKLPYWLRGRSLRNRPALTDHLDADVVIVGAGVAGLCTAYALNLMRKSVVVVDQRQVGGGESARTPGYLRCAFERGFQELIAIHGCERTRLAAQSHRAAMSWIGETIHKERIDCGFEQVLGHLIGFGREGPERVVREAAATEELGISGVGLERIAVYDREPEVVLTFENQAVLNPLAFMEGLAGVVEERGGQVFCGSRVTEVLGGAPASVTTEDGKTIRCDAVVLATNAPLLRGGGLDNRQACYRRYVIERSGTCALAGIIWDTAFPPHFARPVTDGYLVGGGDHRTGWAGEDIRPIVDELEAWGRSRLGIGGENRSIWSKQILRAVDGLPFIGHDPGGEENVFIVSGDCGNVGAGAGVAALLMRDLVLGRYNEWKEVYDPARIIDGEVDKRVPSPPVWLIDQPLGALLPGCGMVAHAGPEPVAVFKRDDGGLDIVSGVCPHDGCPLRWNAFEQSWDCPSDGSRYSTAGEVLNGPSQERLPRRAPPIERRFAVQ